MDIWNALRRTGRDDITTRAIIANVIHDIFPKPVDIQSVKMHGNKIIVTTGNPLINSELMIREWDIKKAVIEKLSQLGIKISQDISLRFS